MTDLYYRFVPHTVTVAGQQATFFDRAALGDLQEHLTSAQLLDQNVRLSRDAQVLCLHCGTGLAGLAAAVRAPGGHVTLIDSHVVATLVARRTLNANHVAHADVLLGDCAQPVHGQTFDHVLAHLPKSRAAWQQTVLDAAQALNVDGTLYLAGANKSGIKSAAKYVERVFGNVSVLGYRGGCRVLCAVKTAQPPPVIDPSDDYYTWRTVQAEVDSASITYATKPGLFAWKQLDQGTRLLLKTLSAYPLQADDRVWDIGCGGGPLTVLAARQAFRGQVTATDVDVRAVQGTQKTIDVNQLHNAEAQLSDCAEALQGRTFGAIVTNPPFHQARATTYAITEQIIGDAARLLEPGGRLYLVANSFLRYKPMLKRAFGDAQLLAETRGFKVWHAVKT
jgi:16S rRNA (guanine1207-N2)-methyltransferase